MGGGSITAKVDIRGVERKVSDSQMKRARPVVADQILTDTDRYVPMKDGDLRASGHVANGGEHVVWNTVYAKAQYEGKNGRAVFRKYTTSGTGKKWYAKAEQNHMDDWVETAADALGVK